MYTLRSTYSYIHVSYFVTKVQVVVGLMQYFDQVMVLTDDKKLRTNRLAQLGQLRELFLDIADISGIPTT